MVRKQETGGKRMNQEFAENIDVYKRQGNSLNGTERIYFPICDNKTRTMIREDTELRRCV